MNHRFVFAAALVLVGCTPHNPDAVTESELSEHVRFLASDELLGRRVGEPGIASAERYIAEQFKADGLLPLPGDDDYFSDFLIYAYAFHTADTSFSVTTGDTTVDYRLGDDYRPFDFTGVGSIDGSVVFAGYGITAPELGYDDYQGLDVKGKVVLVMRHEPGETDPNSPFDGTKQTMHAYFLEKAKNAVRHGAVAMLLYTDPLHHAEDEDLRSVELFTLDGSPPRRRPPDDVGIPALHVSRAVARNLLGADEEALKQLQRDTDGGRGPSNSTHGQATVRISVGRTDSPRSVWARNVVGFIPGSSDRWIVFGAHHDHIGSFVGVGDTIYNGADDNASGTSMVLELAEYFGSLAGTPSRNLAFVTFSAEEVGLLGSRAIVNKRWRNPSSVEIMINFDMIGRNPDQPIAIYGDGFIEGMTEWLAELATDSGLEIELEGRKYEPMSDHHIFYERHTPFLMFHTGEHEDYHGVGDHANALDYGRMEAIGVFSIELVDRVLASEKPLQWLYKVPEPADR